MKCHLRNKKYREIEVFHDTNYSLQLGSLLFLIWSLCQGTPRSRFTCGAESSIPKDFRCSRSCFRARNFRAVRTFLCHIFQLLKVTRYRNKGFVNVKPVGCAVTAFTQRYDIPIFVSAINLLDMRPNKVAPPALVAINC